MKSLVYLILAALLLNGIHGFGRGPPWKMCSLMIPKHSGIQQQTGSAPFEIRPAKLTYAPGEVIQVTIASIDSANPFKGFILGARPLNGDTESVVGIFENLPANAKGSSWYASTPNAPNCVSHSNAEEKTSLTFSWKAPAVSVGAIIFSSAFVKDYRTFWANVSSPIVTADPPVTLPPFASAISQKFSSMDLTDSCGKEKGCILYPKHCSPPNCEWTVAYKKLNESHFDFEMIGVSSGYITMALSHDRLMGKDSTFTCTITEDKKFVSVQNGYNPAYNNERHRIVDFTNIELARFDDKIYCRFRRPINVAITTVAVNSSNLGTYSQLAFSLNDPWYVFLAVGGLYTETDVLGKHKQEPLITPYKVNFMENKIVFASVFPIMVQLHGTFMLMAWMLCAGLGAILAGHFKDLITKMTCGTRLWFQMHRSLMICVAALTAIGLILIFVSQGGWKDRGTVHGAVGLTAVCLMVLQMIMGFVRPDPDHKRRPIFNWAHQVLGYTTIRFACVAFLLAFTMSHIPPTLRYYNTIVFACWLGLQIIWEMIFRIISWQFNKQRNNMVVVSDGNNIQFDKVDEPPEFTEKRKFILFSALFFYLLSIIIFFSVGLAFIYVF